MASVFKAEFDLPASMLRDIGRLIVRYAYLEQYLQNTIYMVIGVHPGIGRLAVREPGRLTDKLDMLLDLMAARNLKCPEGFNIKEVREAIDDIMDMRNLCAHSSWMWDSDIEAWAVFVARGQWSGVPRSERARRNKRLFPEGQIIKSATLKLYVSGTDALRKAFRDLQASLREQLRERQQSRPQP
jgi:hypothetical protein